MEILKPASDGRKAVDSMGSAARNECLYKKSNHYGSKTNFCPVCYREVKVMSGETH